MTRCEEFYEKWKRDPNWCDKCPSAVYYINRYVELAEKYPGLKQVSEGSTRPILGKMDESTREKVVQEIQKRIDEGRKVDAGIVANIAKQFTIVKEKTLSDEIDTGVKFYCEHCGNHYLIIHEAPDKHRFQKVQII